MVAIHLVVVMVVMVIVVMVAVLGSAGDDGGCVVMVGARRDGRRNMIVAGNS